MTPLMDAAHTGNGRRVRRLLACDADPRLRDARGSTALEYALAFPRSAHHQVCAAMLRLALSAWRDRVRNGIDGAHHATSLGSF
jgi:ankyrin repeat protein